MADTVTVPHEADEVSAAIKRGYDMMAAGLNATSTASVHPVEELRKKRRDEGYFPEDGTTKSHGKDGDLYDNKWIEDFAARQKLLDEDRYYQFAVMVSSSANLPLQDFTNETEIQRSVAERIRKTQERIEQEERDRKERESTAPEVDSQQERVNAAAQAVQTTVQVIAELESSAEEFVAKSKNEELKTGIKQAQTSETLAAKFVAHANQKYGSGGLKSAREEMQNFAIKIGGASTMDEIKKAVPQSSTSALYWAFLVHCPRDAELVYALSKTGDLHAPGSLYAKDPLTYARDVFALSRLIDDKFGVLFAKTSLGFYDQLKSMAENSLIDVTQFPCPPQPPVPVKQTKKGRNQVILDIYVDERPADLCDAGHLYKPEELDRIRAKVVDNNAAQKTRELFNAVLDPMFNALFPLIFFDSDEPFPELSPTAERKIDDKSLFELIVETTATLLKSLETTYSEKGTEKQKERYGRELMQYAVTSSGVLLAAARYILARRAANLQTFLPKEQEAVLAAFVANQTSSTAAAAYATFSLLFSDNAQPDNDCFLTEPSHLKFYNLAKAVQDDKSALEKGKLEGENELLKLQKAILAKRVADRKAFLESKSAPVREQSLAAELEKNYVPTVTVAMSPQNSGLLVYSILMKGALQESERILRAYVPCVADRFKTINEMIESDYYWQLLASLVRANVRYIEVRNPNRYVPIIAEERSRIGLRSALQEMRRAALLDGTLVHRTDCTCQPRRRTGFADLLYVASHF